MNTTAPVTSERLDTLADAGPAPALNTPAAVPLIRASRLHRSQRLHRCLTAAMLLCFALAGWLWSQPHARSASVLAPDTPVSVESDSAPQLVTRKIEEIQPGQRLPARNPLRHETSPPSKPDPATWRLVRLTMTDRRGILHELAFLRRLEWLAATEAEPGRTIALALPELSISGPARVEAVLPCPPIEPDDGSGRSLVTGTMRHVAEDVLDLSVSGLEEPIGVTATHPLWSETRQTFVPAATLLPGEQLRTATGRIAQVTRIAPRRSPPEYVYNLEVDAEHVYQVGATGVLVHNSCMTPDQIALKELVDEASLGGRKALDSQTANTVLDWADEVKYPGWRATADDLAPIANHWIRGPHIHIPSVGSGHIPVLSGVVPR